MARGGDERCLRHTKAHPVATTAAQKGKFHAVLIPARVGAWQGACGAGQRAVTSIASHPARVRNLLRGPYWVHWSAFRRSVASWYSLYQDPLALGSTLYRWKIQLSDVDRGVYEALDLRLARHPSENLRYLVTRAIAYALSFEEGIAFSKEGIASSEEPPVVVRDPAGNLVAWIDVGSPAPERLHKASKAARRVALFSSANLSPLFSAAKAGAIHRASAIEVWQLDPEFLDQLGERVERNTDFEIVHTSSQLYVTLGGQVLEGTVSRATLLPTP